MDFLDMQIPPPGSWSLFEELCLGLFGAIWEDPHAVRHGRTGQPQWGVDVYGTRPAQPGCYLGVQCKGKDGNLGSKPTVGEFDDELAKADGFEPRLAHWTFVTTAPDDVALQAHVRAVSTKRVAQGLFPVQILGWGSLQSRLAQHPQIIEQFYPSLGPQLPELIERLKRLPDDVLAAMESRVAYAEPPAWQAEIFSDSRDLGPALHGRPLGPADVAACPELPQVERAWRELKGGYSVRIVGNPGAGKSVCAYQVARRAHAEGWRVVRLHNPQTSSLHLLAEDGPILHIVDDAHLTDQTLLRRAEEQAGPTCWLLTAHTITEDKTPSPGEVRINGDQAVGVIAAGLRKNLAETLRVVRNADDRVGDDIGDERIEDRLAEAEKAERPWQFCFILGGGWRRAAQSADDARQAKADIFLAIAAVRQIATRDARAGIEDLKPLLSAAGLSHDQSDAIEWLARARLLLSSSDLRCPHQRLSIVLIRQILLGQDRAGRQAIAAAIGEVLQERTYPFVGLQALLLELRMWGSGDRRWNWLVEKVWLTPLIDRCWRAEDPIELRGAAFLLAELQSYLDDWPAAITAGYEETAARWFSEAQPECAYGVGYLFGQIAQKNKAIGQGLLSRTDVAMVARAVSQRDPIAASEAASMVYQSIGCRPDGWLDGYLIQIDREQCLNTVQNWPKEHYLSAVGTFCQVLTFDDQPFGLDLIEALIPAVAERLRTDPFESFHELSDMIRGSLRLEDFFGLYVGKNGPTLRMRSIGAKIVAAWDFPTLGRQISAIPRRDLPSGWRLLEFVKRAAPRSFEKLVAQIDWEAIDATIGDAWGHPGHDIQVFLQVCFQAKSAREPIRTLISRNRTRMEPLSVRLAMLAPQVALDVLDDGRMVSLSSHSHFHWRMSASVLAQLLDMRADNLERLITPHAAIASQKLSSPTQPFFDEPLGFLRLLKQFLPDSLERILSAIDADGAEKGWATAFATRRPEKRVHKVDLDKAKEERDTAAWLIDQCCPREDALGAAARRLRRRYPRRSLPAARLLAPITQSSGTDR